KCHNCWGFGDSGRSAVVDYCDLIRLQLFFDKISQNKMKNIKKHDTIKTQKNNTKKHDGQLQQ
ncbi:MAG: hypothetical protein FWD00_05015, partial [Clostridiales bacterium]|nr:hypothetical protein [Clostridiales bacterium]